VTFKQLAQLSEDLNIIQKFSDSEDTNPSPNTPHLMDNNRDIVNRIADLKRQWLAPEVPHDPAIKDQMNILRKQLWDNKFLIDPNKTKADLLKLDPRHPLRRLFKDKLKK